MALTKSTTIDMALRQAMDAGLTLTEENIESNIQSALNDLPDFVASLPRAARLEKDYTITFASGVASLTAKTDLKTDYIKRVIHSDGTIISLLPRNSTPTDLTYERNQMFYWGILWNDSIRAKLGDGSNDVPDGDGTLTGLFQPTDVSLVPSELIGDFITLLVMKSREGAAAPAAA